MQNSQVKMENLVVIIIIITIMKRTHYNNNKNELTTQMTSQVESTAAVAGRGRVGRVAVVLVVDGQHGAVLVHVAVCRVRWIGRAEFVLPLALVEVGATLAQIGSRANHRLVAIYCDHRVVARRDRW